MYKIDRKKWLEAVKAVDAFRAEKEKIQLRIARKELDWLEAYKDPALKPFVSYRDEKGELTKLYSIRAMARDRIHRKRARIGNEIVDLGWDDQLKYVGDAWKEYEATPAGVEPATSTVG